VPPKKSVASDQKKSVASVQKRLVFQTPAVKPKDNKSKKSKKSKKATPAQECRKRKKNLANLEVLQKCLANLSGVKWYRCWRKQPDVAAERVIDALTYNHLREMCFEFMLCCTKEQQRDVAANWLDHAKNALSRDSELQRQKIERAMEIAKNFEESVKNADVPEDLRDDSILEQLSAQFDFATPGIREPDVNVVAAAAASSAAAAASSAAEEASSATAEEASSATAEEASSATAEEASSVAEEASSAKKVKPFVYRVDDEFEPQEHWQRSFRGTSGFKYVTHDDTKAKPWRVKVCALFVP